jgi:hypothetical protein
VKILNDNINLLIVLLFASLAYITLFKGRWSDKVKLTDVYNTDQRIRLSKTTFIDPVYSIEANNGIFNVDGNFTFLNDSLSIDTLIITLTEINDKNSREKSQVAVSTNINGSRSAIHQVFQNVSKGSQRFLVGFNFKESTGRRFKTTIDLKRTKNFELAARNERDLIIVLYPVLWIAFGVLVLVKITNLVRDNDPDDTAEKKNDKNEEEDYF